LSYRRAKRPESRDILTGPVPQYLDRPLPWGQRGAIGSGPRISKRS